MSWFTADQSNRDVALTSTPIQRLSPPIAHQHDDWNTTNRDSGIHSRPSMSHKAEKFYVKYLCQSPFSENPTALDLSMNRPAGGLNLSSSHRSVDSGRQSEISMSQSDSKSANGPLPPTDNNEKRLPLRTIDGNIDGVRVPSQSTSDNNAAMLAATAVTPSANANEAANPSHSRSESAPNRELVLTCPKCEKSYYKKASFKQHMATHNPRHRCNICSKLFSRKSLLDSHVTAVHNRERPFPCRFCSFCSADKSNLRAHEKRRHRKK